MSRLLMNLLQWEFNVIPSIVLKQDETEYIKALKNAREEEDSKSFITYIKNLHTNHLKDDIQKYLKSINSDVVKVAI